MVSFARQIIGPDGARLAVLSAGGGHPVVLLHGLGSRAAEIAAPLAPLAEGSRVVAVDRPGYGDSDSGPAGFAGPADQARRVRAALRGMGVRRPVLVGHSYGAAVALAWALQAPDTVAGLVLVAPFAAPTPEAWMPLLRVATAPVCGPLLRRLLLPKLAPGLARRRLRGLFRPHPAPPSLSSLDPADFVGANAILATARDLRAFNADATALWPRLRGLDRRRNGPAIVIVAGANDRVADAPRHVDMLCRLLPRAQVVRLPAVGHMPHHAQPEAVIAAVRALLPDRAPEREQSA